MINLPFPFSAAKPNTNPPAAQPASLIALIQASLELFVAVRAEGCCKLPFAVAAIITSLCTTVVALLDILNGCGDGDSSVTDTCILFVRKESKLYTALIHYVRDYTPGTCIFHTLRGRAREMNFSSSRTKMRAPLSADVWWKWVGLDPPITVRQYTCAGLVLAMF